MYKYTLVLALLSIASAQSTTRLLLIGFGTQDIVASIVGSDSTATTFAIACGDPDSEDCGIPTSFIFTQGPSTIHYDYHNTDDGSDDTSTAYTTSVSTGASNYVQYLPVTITAGAAGSSASIAASTTQQSSDADSATKSASGSAASQTSGMTTATSTEASATKTSSSTGSSASSSAVSTAGMAMVTGSPQWALGGAAAALALAVI
ncbi:hypothetical protein LOCC1_G001531 [Lachnellula occidentalis]|uniref:GPI anchored protein n=1 Tax=Lachnellula occidentalis TaxID=215460 RepID=A0A8H8S6R6_9HELO|nr:hypothetical protein LOCC1_G001531 [Lachnellula occidentalis]